MVVDIILNKALICKGHLNNDLYVLKQDDSSLHHIESNKRIKLSPTNETYLWHLRLGHINLNRIQRLVKDGPLSNLKVESLPVCESCLEGKMTKRSFKSKGHRANEVLELVHTDVCGPISVQARGGFEYFITFTDDYCRGL
ncbi:putative mitochondrial protein AtMg00300 [Primulina tabacum]|uniref:putative mitochondrial protein AtMg00300 n=1 Tax=Primulina tabacum TaxID=48773 RepID=UPI003F599403